MNVQNLLGKPVDGCFEEAERTGKLLLSKRNLREFPKNCVNFDMQDVYSIELSNNKFKRVPESLKNCMILTRLDLHNNFIQEFSPDLKNLPSLKELILSRNSLTAFPLVITTYNLQYLDISCNLIKIVPEDIRYLKKLKVLNLSSNYLKLLPNTIGQLSCLRQLNVSRNKLEQVPEELQYCPLMNLDLSFNKLHMIPPSFRHLIRLQDINLESNPLRHPPAKLCSLGKAHIFKYLSLLASHMDSENNLTTEEKEMQKRYKEAQERQLYRPVSVKSNFEDFEIEPYDYSPSISHMSLNTPSSSALDDYRITTPDVPDTFQRSESSQMPDYNSIYHDFLKRDKNSNDELEVPNGRFSPVNKDILRSKRSVRKSDTKRRSSIRESEQKPVLSMYATIPRSYRRPTTPSTGDSDDGTQDLFKVKPRSRPGLTLSPYLKRPFDNFGSEDPVIRHRTLENKKSLDSNLEDPDRRSVNKQLNLGSLLESNRSSSSTASYFTSPFSYSYANPNDLQRSKSQKVSRSEAHLHNRSRTNSNPPNYKAPVGKKSESEASDSTVSDTTPKASPEPPESVTPPPEAVLILDNENRAYLPPPPVPPPRSFPLSQDRESLLKSPPKSIARVQSARTSVEGTLTPLIQDSDRFFRMKKKSSGASGGEDHQNLTIRRREYNSHVASTQIDYIIKEVNKRLGITIDGNFEDSLKDGVLACQLVNLVNPDLIQIHFPEPKKPLNTKQITLNREKFLDGCRQVGVPTNLMCTAADLVSGDLSKVLKTFVHLLNSTTV